MSAWKRYEDACDEYVRAMHSAYRAGSSTAAVRQAKVSEMHEASQKAFDEWKREEAGRGKSS